MQTKKKKSQKPIDIDLHLKYVCPESKCNSQHWLSLKETQTKNFKVVCTCGRVFKPKQIQKVNIVYKKKHTIVQEPLKTNEQNQSIPKDLQSKCIKLLHTYGLTESEAIDLLDKAYAKNPTTEAGLLIKDIIQNLGECNVNT